MKQMIACALERALGAARPVLGRSLYATLANLERSLRGPRGPDSLARLLTAAKVAAYRALRSKFRPAAAQALALKVVNICLARFQWERRHISLLARPIGIVTDPSNGCGLSCPGCVHSRSAEMRGIFDWPNGMLPPGRFAALLRAAGPYAIGVYFCNYGEPILNPGTPDLVSMARRYLLSTALSTSLSVPKLDADAYVSSGLDYIGMSIDGATQPVYERYRRGGNLDLVFENLRTLARAKRRLRSRTPVLSWNFLAFEHNAHEIPLAQRLARELGADRFQVLAPFSVAWDDPGIRPAAHAPKVYRRYDFGYRGGSRGSGVLHTRELDEEAIGEAFERSWSGELEPDQPVAPFPSCQWLYRNVVMDATGRIMPCCASPRPDADLVFTTIALEPRHPLNSEKHRLARASFVHPGLKQDASFCARCEWSHEAVNIGGPEIRTYLLNADIGLFDRRLVRLLAEW